jgi:hypothetical protein
MQVPYVYAPYKLAGATVDVDGRLGRARTTIGMQLLLIAIDSYNSQLYPS